MPASLYERLGRTDGLRNLARTIINLHIENPVVNKRYAPLANDPQRFETVLQHVVDFLEEGSGGSATYKGKSMPEAHAGMNISGEEFLAVLDDIMHALKKHGVDEQSQKDVLAISYSLKPQIVRL
jgi:hemoglobin